MTADISNRTLVLSVVAVDLVGYSRTSVAGQMARKDNFNQVLLEAIHDIPLADRIILDTGDGVAIGFLGDPEDALYVALFMHDAINRERAVKASDGIVAAAGAIRIGINLGPVKLATGVDGHPHIIGDGINVAERIMAFAEPGQITASRPFFEVMSTLSEHYATLFQYAGVRTDSQVRAHDVYLVGKSVAAFEHAGRGVAQRAAQRLVPRAGQSVAPPLPTTVSAAPSRQPATVAKVQPSAPAELIERHSALIDFLEDRKKVATTATLLAVLAVVLAALLIQRKMAITSTTEMTTVAAASTLPASVDSGARVSSPPPAPVVAATVPTKAGPTSEASKTSTPAPAPTAVPSKSPPVSVAAAAPVTPAATPAGTSSAKNSERPSPPVAAAAAAPATSIAPSARDKPKDAKVERAELRDRADKPALREEIRAEPRKVPPRSLDDRERKLPNTAPVMPTYQSSVQPPQPETVAPTPTPPPAPAPDTRVVIVARSEPSYPVEGVRQGILKLVIVKARVTIDARGGVTDVVILEGGPISAFGRETRLTLKQWKFNPGTSGRTLDIEISFKP